MKLALTKNNVNISVLIEKLCTISAVTHKKIQVFDEEIFKKLKSLNDLWKNLNTLWSIFNYELLCYIVKISECKEAQDILENFLIKLDPSAIKGADLVLHYKEKSWEESLMPILRIEIKSEKCTIEIQKTTEKILSKIYGLSKFALHLQYAKKSCQLIYFISKPLKLYLLQFEITGSIMAEFLANCINSIHIDNFELKIPSKSIDLMVSSVCSYILII